MISLVDVVLMDAPTIEVEVVVDEAMEEELIVEVIIVVVAERTKYLIQ